MSDIATQKQILLLFCQKKAICSRGVQWALIIESLCRFPRRMCCCAHAQSVPSVSCHPLLLISSDNMAHTLFSFYLILCVCLSIFSFIPSLEDNITNASLFCLSPSLSLSLYLSLSLSLSPFFLFYLFKKGIFLFPLLKDSLYRDSLF